MAIKFQKRALGKRVKKLYGHPRQWTEEQIKNASGLLAGIESTGLNDINNDALIKALPEIKDVDFPSHKGRILAKKLQQKMGDVNQWNMRLVVPTRMKLNLSFRKEILRESIF